MAAPQNLAKERLFANPSRPQAFHDGGRQQILDMGGAVSAGTTTFKNYFTGVFGLIDLVSKQLELYKAVVPGLHRVLTLVDPSDPALKGQLKDAEGARRDFEEGLRREPADELSWLARGLPIDAAKPA